MASTNRMLSGKWHLEESNKLSLLDQAKSLTDELTLVKEDANKVIKRTRRSRIREFRP